MVQSVGTTAWSQVQSDLYSSIHATLQLESFSQTFLTVISVIDHPVAIHGYFSSYFWALHCPAHVSWPSFQTRNEKLFMTVLTTQHSKSQMVLSLGPPPSPLWNTQAARETTTPTKMPMLRIPEEELLCKILRNPNLIKRKTFWGSDRKIGRYS